MHLWRRADVSCGVVAISFDTGLVAGFIIASRCYIAFRGKDAPPIRASTSNEGGARLILEVLANLDLYMPGFGFFSLFGSDPAGHERFIFGAPAPRFGKEEGDIPLMAGDEWAADRVASGARYSPAYHPGQAGRVPVRVHR